MQSDELFNLMVQYYTRNYTSSMSKDEVKEFVARLIGTYEGHERDIAIARYKFLLGLDLEV